MECNFNPRSPCGERLSCAASVLVMVLFQSTLPVWGATLGRMCYLPIRRYFNPRSPCGERPASPSWPEAPFDFNPRSPCGERLLQVVQPSLCVIFQSTLPVWGATYNSGSVSLSLRHFNPRSPCGERRWYCGCLCDRSVDFNPRSPCGERLSAPTAASYAAKFQSTLPVWGATYLAALEGVHGRISIHAPRVGSDSSFLA